MTKTLAMRAAAAVVSVAAVAGLLGWFVHVMPPLFLGGLVTVLAAAAAIGWVSARACIAARFSRGQVALALAFAAALFAITVDLALDYRAWRVRTAERADEILAWQSIATGPTAAMKRHHAQRLAARDFSSFVDEHPKLLANAIINGALACAVAGVVSHHKVRA